MFEPTDEQIANLSHAEAEVCRTFAVDTEGTTQFVAHPAFQAIIRAAQAAVFREAVEEVRADWYPDTCPWIGYLVDKADAIEAADV